MVTDNVGSPDFRIFGAATGARTTFRATGTSTLATRCRRQRKRRASKSISTIVSPVNWVYSVRNVLADLGVGDRTLRHLSLRSPVARRRRHRARHVALGNRKRRAAQSRLPEAGLTTTRPVVILGGGIAGLVAARDLGRRGVRSIVLEAGTDVGGLAATKRDADGFSYDVGAHFITNRLAAAVDLGHACRRVSHYGETVSLRGRSFDYPFGLALRPRYALSAVAGRLGSRVESAVSAAEWFRASYGPSLADEVAIPLLEAWSGLPAEQLAAAVGGNIPSSIAATMFRRSVARMSHRAVAIGYSHDAAERVGVFHVYPEEGASAICRALAKNQTADIRLGTPVERIHLEDERVVGVTAAGVDLDVRAVVSTLPVDVLSLLAPDATALVPVKRFRYRSMVFVNLRLRGRGLLPEVVTWTPEHQFPFSDALRPLFRCRCSLPKGRRLSSPISAAKSATPRGRPMMQSSVNNASHHWSQSSQGPDSATLAARLSEQGSPTRSTTSTTRISGRHSPDQRGFVDLPA